MKTRAAFHSTIALRLACTVALSFFLSSCGAQPTANAAGSTWQAKMGTVRVAVQGDQADPDRIADWTGYKAHIRAMTGLTVQVAEATDYNGVIQALSTGQVDLGTMGGGSYANVDAQIGSKAAPILTVRQAEGVIGYYSALLVRADSPYHSLADLRGKKIAYVDFNSTSGYIFPRYIMSKQRLDPDSFFGATIMAGGAAQAALAMMNGQVDAAMVNVSGGTPETGFTTGGPYSLARRGMLKLEDTRIIWTAGPIPNSPMVIHTDRPRPFVDAMRGALAILPYERPDVWEQMNQTAGSTLAPVSRATYSSVIAIRNEDIARRKGQGVAK
ncbi:MAG: phosphate/phosphite/phosphonate ABC transporter substrate-binding protein [Sphingomonas sp.]